MLLLSSVLSPNLKIKAAHFCGMLITHLLNYIVSYPTAEDFILWYCCNFLFVCIEGVSEIK